MVLPGKGSGVFFGQRLTTGRNRWPKKTPDPGTIRFTSFVSLNGIGLREDREGAPSVNYRGPVRLDPSRPIRQSSAAGFLGFDSRVLAGGLPLVLAYYLHGAFFVILLGISLPLDESTW